MEGSRSGLNIALCWASLLFHGFEGYKETSVAVTRITRQICSGLVSATPFFRRKRTTETWRLQNCEHPGASSAR